MTPGTHKASWIGKTVDAHRFATYLEMSLPDFNKCFSLKDGKKLMHKNKDKNEKSSDLVNTLQKHIIK